MDELSEEERAIVALVHDFVEREVKPVASGLEHANTYPEKLIEQMKQLGIYGLAIPEPWGAARVSTPCYALVTEELARGWMSLAGAMGGHTVVAKLLLDYGTDAQKEHYLPRMATGEVRATMALTEAGRRFRPAGHAHDRPPRWRFLSHQRFEDMDYERPAFFAGRFALQDRSGRPSRARGDQHPAGRARARVHCLA